MAEILIGITDPLLVLFLEFVLRGIGQGVPGPPEKADELGPVGVGLEPGKDGALGFGDDRRDVLEPAREVR
jgi:hypothetical protein